MNWSMYSPMKRWSFILISIILMAGCVSERDIKVISFNVRLSVNDTFDGENNWKYRKEGAVKLIQNESPDLFGLQEALYNQALYMEENLPEYTKYGVDREGGLEKGEAESCALFYRTDRFKELEKGTFWLSETPDVPSKGWDADYRRVVTWILLKEKGLFGKKILYMNTHFDHKGKEARLQSGKLVVERIGEIAKNGEVVILTGDFNAKIEDPSLAPIRKTLDYSREKAPVTDSLGTFNNWGKNENVTIIDHIFYRGVTPERYRVITDDYGVPYISDHYPILFEGRL